MKNLSILTLFLYTAISLTSCAKVPQEAIAQHQICQSMIHQYLSLKGLEAFKIINVIDQNFQQEQSLHYQLSKQLQHLPRDYQYQGKLNINIDCTVKDHVFKLLINNPI